MGDSGFVVVGTTVKREDLHIKYRSPQQVPTMTKKHSLSKIFRHWLLNRFSLQFNQNQNLARFYSESLQLLRC